MTEDSDNVRLLETMRRYNQACNYVTDRVFESRMSKYQIQKQLYYDVKGMFHLPAQSTIRLISKVVEACSSSYEIFKQAKILAAIRKTEPPLGPIKPTFKDFGAIQYDQRNSRVGIDQVSLRTLNQRIELKTDVGEYHRMRFQNIRGECNLIRRNGTFYLIVSRETKESPEYTPTDVLGVDLGVNNIAVDTDKQVFDNKLIERARRWYGRRRSILQHIGTKSAKRRLKKLSGKERGFKKDTNHCISKQIISKAKDTQRAIAIEDLKNIRSRVTVRHEQRDRHSKWAFDELRNFLTYGTKSEGVPLMVVSPENTSRRCPKCRHVEKKYRNKNQFECLKCHFKEMADYVATINIAAKARTEAAVNQPHGGALSAAAKVDSSVAIRPDVKQMVVGKPSCFSGW